jgi:hypothetical protein
LNGADDLDQALKAAAREASESDISSRPIGRTFFRVCNKSALGPTPDIRLQKGNSMNDDDKQRSAADAELEREIRQGRKFTAREAMATGGEAPL